MTSLIRSYNWHDECERNNGRSPNCDLLLMMAFVSVSDLGDDDNDGFLDLFVGVNNFGSDWLYHNNGSGGFTKITTGAIVNSGANANNCVGRL